MIEGLSLKAQDLYDELKRRGGGMVDEYMLRTRIGISHGSFSAARRELLEAGALRLEKEGRHTIYVLQDLSVMRSAAAASAEAASEVRQAVAAGEKRKMEGDGRPLDRPASPETGGVQAMARAVDAMPRVTGDFADMDDWEDALTMELGSCLDISASLTVEGEYMVYSHTYEQSAVYSVREGGCGIVVE